MRKDPTPNGKQRSREQRRQSKNNQMEQRRQMQQ